MRHFRQIPHNNTGIENDANLGPDEERAPAEPAPTPAVQDATRDQNPDAEDITAKAELKNHLHLQLCNQFSVRLDEQNDSLTVTLAEIDSKAELGKWDIKESGSQTVKLQTSGYKITISRAQDYISFDIHERGLGGYLRRNIPLPGSEQSNDHYLALQLTVARDGVQIHEQRGSGDMEQELVEFK